MLIIAQVPLILEWNEGGQNVAVAGTFTGWRKRINMKRTYVQIYRGLISGTVDSQRLYKYYQEPIGSTS